jgi:hypothetical protein
VKGDGGSITRPDKDLTMRTTALTAALSTALLLAGASGAAGAPPDAETITVHCDNGEHYEIQTNGMGSFTPGHIVGSTDVIVPVCSVT